MTTGTEVHVNMCACGAGKIIAQGQCLNCRKNDEAKYRAEQGLVQGATAVGQVHGQKFHKLVARPVVWGGVATMRWMGSCGTTSNMYGYPVQGAAVDCKRCGC